MRVLDCVADLEEDVDEASAAVFAPVAAAVDCSGGVGFFQQFVEADAFDFFHDEEGASGFVAAEIVGREYVGVFEHAAEAGLVFEQFFAIVRVRGFDDLDGDVAVEDCVAEAEHLSLSAFAEHVEVVVAVAVVAAGWVVVACSAEEAGEEVAVGFSEGCVQF